jgi:hypothetical protein
MPNDISTELAIFRALKEQLAEQEGLEPDDPFIIGTIEGITSLSEAIVALVRSARADEARMDALGSMIDELSERLSRYKQRSASKRAKAAWAMAESGMKKLEEADVTISLRNNPAGIQYTCEPHEAPEEFVTVKTSYSWNRAAVKEALDKGDLPFAHKTNGGQNISVRTK